MKRTKQTVIKEFKDLLSMIAALHDEKAGLYVTRGDMIRQIAMDFQESAVELLNMAQRLERIDSELEMTDERVHAIQHNLVALSIELVMHHGLKRG